MTGQTEPLSGSADIAENDTGGTRKRPTARRWKVLVLLLLLGSAWLGWFAYETSETLDRTRQSLDFAERSLYSTRNDLSQAESAVSRLERTLGLSRSQSDDLSRQVERVETEIKATRKTIFDLRSSLGLSRSSERDIVAQVTVLSQNLDEYRQAFEDAQSSASSWRTEAQRLADELDSCVTIANERQRKINSAIDTANSGMMWLTDIPSKGFTYSLGDPYEKLRKEYNDLVGRFNAALQRINDLSNLLSRSLGEL